MNNKVLILDFGSQYTKLIARRIRDLNVYAEIVPFSITFGQLRKKSPGAIILSGGPSSVYEKNAPMLSDQILKTGIPILGICYGLHLIAHLSGMKVAPAKCREYGMAHLEIVKDKEGKSPSRLLKNLPDHSKVWMSHGDKISQYPSDFKVTARTTNSEMAVLESEKRKIYGIQFHPEVVHTEEGEKIFSNFLFSIAGLKPEWNMENFIKSSFVWIREKIGKEKVILGLSGGVDSTALALLLRKAVGDQLVPVFIDTGLLRKNEYSDLMLKFKKELNLEVVGIDASAIFIKNLNGIRTPERKRKVIGKTFIEVFQKVEKRVGRVKFFAQGTLYPDVIESASIKGPSVTIKSHHNVGGLPRKLKWELIEPFKELFKDEVRKVGKELGLDEKFINRHPFPGPGLAVRILGRITREKIIKLQQADAILIEELENFDLYNKIWQAFVVLLPVRTVGVMGDIRTYENVAVIRLVSSVDGMTADWYPAPYDFLKKVSNRIVNDVKGINRVTYDLTSKPPGTIEWE